MSNKNKLLDRFVRFIEHHNLFTDGQPVLLTVSGGLDSVVMAELFRRAGFPYGIAHVNFQLRATESDEDETFVNELADRHGVRFHTTRVPTKERADELGVSTQMAARQLRYDWFETVATESGYDRIATAHHQDDVLETLLLNLIRGTGLTGLRSIPVQQGRIIRPLWFADRTQIAEFANEHALLWREDSSNASDHYRRNRLRHQVVPVLKSMNPSLLQTLQTTVTRLQSADALVDQEIRRSWEQLAENRPTGVALPIQQLIALPEWEYRLGEWLKPYGFQYAQIGPVADAVRSAGFGQTFYSETHQLTRDRDFLLIELRQSADQQPLVLESIPASDLNVFGHFSLRFEWIDKTADFQPLADPRFAFLDADQIQWPMTIRFFQPGDRFRPLGMKGAQTVGNFLTNQKVTLAARRTAAVLLSGDQVIWLIGYRLDDRFRITSQTRKILKIEQKLTS